MHLWRVSVPLELPGKSIYVRAASWYDAREICRIVYRDASLEENWRNMEMVEVSQLDPSDRILFRDEQGEIQTKINSPPPAPVKKKLRGRKRRKK